MKRSGPVYGVFILSLAAWMMVPASALGQDDEFTVVVIMVERLVTEGPDYERAEEEFNRERTDRSIRLQAKREELLAVQERVITAASTLDAESRAALVQNAEELQTEVDRMTADIQTGLSTFGEELMVPIYDQVDAAILSYVEEYGVDLVLDGSNPSLGMQFLHDAADITDSVLERMRSGVSTAPLESPPN